MTNGWCRSSTVSRRRPLPPTLIQQQRHRERRFLIPQQAIVTGDQHLPLRAQGLRHILDRADLFEAMKWITLLALLVSPLVNAITLDELQQRFAEADG